MIALLWLAGLVRRRAGRLLASTAGVALAVALLASIASFLSGALATMTAAATRQVAVDWQVEAHAGTDPSAVLAAVRVDPHVQRAVEVEYADTTGLQATTGGSVQSTGPGVVLGLPAGYATAFPGSLRMLAGNANGVLLAQQTAANLRAGPGDTISVGRPGLDAVTVRVDGVVDLPQADSLFQKVGSTPRAQPSAPPDNILVVPLDRWHGLFDPLGATRPDLVRHQVHATLTRRLPRDPGAAFNQVGGAARHLEAVLAGGASVGDNLGAALDGARSDSLYAQVLFILLGVPGVLLAGLLTIMAAAAAADRRRREFALLRVRGATAAAMVRTAAIEAAFTALVGGAAGLGAAALIGRAAFGSATFGSTPLARRAWAGAAAFAGIGVAIAALVLPAWRDARRLSVAGARKVIGRPERAWWRRAGIDVWLLAASGLVFWLTSRAGYQIVLVPEGLPTLSVNYWTLAAPLLFWVGAGLLAWRLADLLFGAGRRLVAAAARPFAHGLSEVIASSLSRHRHRLAARVCLLALTGAFAASTAMFNATYHHQAGVDARLTNGADVTVAFPSSSPAPNGALDQLGRVPGVHHVEPLLHRYAYVGPDLQDLYGVRTSTIVGAAKLRDVQFGRGPATSLIGRLARQPDAVLVSAETVKDFQLSLGDALHVRLRGRTGQLTNVTFHYAGVAREFPTAPRDSFLVANADYLAKSTGDAGVDMFLVDARGRDVAAVGARVRAVASAATVTDLATTQRQVGSSLTAVNLSGLTRVELGFALALAVGAAGLVLAETLAQRRRSFALARALGARRVQVSAFVRVEAAAVVGAGLAAGAASGYVLAHILVKILTGVFDPPPTALAVPWSYLLALGGLMVVAAVVATELVSRAARRPLFETIRDL